MLRNARSFMSRTRFHVTRRGSRRRALPWEMIVDDGGEQVVGERDRVNVARQVEVEVFHRDHLA